MDAPKVSAERLERFFVGAALLLYLLFEINAALHHGSWGQDFPLHKKWMFDAMAHPWRFLWHLDPTRTAPPVFEWFVGSVYKLSEGHAWLEIVALLSIAFNAAGLTVLYWLLRRVIASRLMRLACFFFIVFVPFAMITAVVFGADALQLPLFLIMVFVTLRLADFQHDKRRFRWLLALLIVLLIVSIGAKLTFVTQIAAVILSLSGLLRKDRFRSAAVAIAIACGAILLTGNIVTIGHYNFPFGTMPGSEMSLRDIVFFRQNDGHVLTAPPYDEHSAVEAPALGVWPAHHKNLLIKDKYSYPALLHLAVYTDIMNIFQYDPSDADFGRRSLENQQSMQWTVRTGIIFSLCFLVLTPIAIARNVYKFFIERKNDSAVLPVMAICGCTWYLNVVAGFPFVMTYIGGYWLPRLIVPALICFFVLSFSELNRLLKGRSPFWRIAVLVAVLIQSGLQLSFLWPSGTMKPY